MDKDIAISVKKVSKTFRIPHEKVNSVRGAFVGALSSFHLPFLRGGQGGVSYEEFKALDDVSFEVKKGEFFGIIGRNGSGKSTLLKVLAGIYQADKGKVKINGMISPFLELGIGFNPELSGRDNVYLNATVLGMTKKQIDEKFDAIVAFSELERFIDQKLKNYSSGMQVRLAFSVSIHANRDILLMDEVLAVGDSNFQAKCLAEFMKYKEMGKTVILVTHDIQITKRFCDRVMLVRNGKIMKIGNAEEVGSEYLHENLADRNIESDEEEANERIVRGAQVASPVITEVKFFDENGQEKSVFETGDDITVKVNFDSPDDINAIDFGIRLHDQNDTYIYGINTLLDEVDVTPFLKGKFFSIRLNNVPFQRGSFFARVNIIGIHPSSGCAFVIDESAKKFKVLSESLNEGHITLDHDWIGVNRKTL